MEKLTEELKVVVQDLREDLSRSPARHTAALRDEQEHNCTREENVHGPPGGGGPPVVSQHNVYVSCRDWRREWILLVHKIVNVMLSLKHPEVMYSLRSRCTGQD